MQIFQEITENECVKGDNLTNTER